MSTTAPEVPKALVDAILGGDCVAFVGAGFSWEVVKGWADLLRRVGGTVPGVSNLLQKGDPLALEAAGQLIQDTLGTQAFEQALHGVAGSIDVGDPRIAHRRKWLLETPFHTILTTNFDNVLAGNAPDTEDYGEVLRSDRPWWKRMDWLQDGADTTRVLKLHGDANGDHARSPVVFSRRAYRHLLYSDRRYGDFLRTLFATRAVLFLGTSFTDAYLNEIRSEVLSLVGKNARAWAVLPDRSEAEIGYFQKDEGIEVLSYSSVGGHQGFDRWLEAIHQKTSTLARLRRLVGGQQLVWVDDNKNNHRGIQRLREAGATVTLLARADELQQAAHQHAALIISKFAHGEGTGNAVLAKVASWGVRPPVIIFASGAFANENRQTVLRRGAFEYCSGWQELFRTIERLASPREDRRP